MTRRSAPRIGSMQLSLFCDGVAVIAYNVNGRSNRPIVNEGSQHDRLRDDLTNPPDRLWGLLRQWVQDVLTDVRSDVAMRGPELSREDAITYLEILADDSLADIA